jgi:hypothetical protein
MLPHVLTYLSTPLPPPPITTTFFDAKILGRVHLWVLGGGGGGGRERDGYGLGGGGGGGRGGCRRVNKMRLRYIVLGWNERRRQGRG